MERMNRRSLNNVMVLIECASDKPVSMEEKCDADQQLRCSRTKHCL